MPARSIRRSASRASRCRRRRKARAPRGARSIGADRACDVDRPRRRVDDRRALDADRMNATAAGAAVLRRAADVVHPDDRAGGLVQRVDVVAGRDREEHTLSAWAVLQIERRREHRAREAGGEAGRRGHRPRPPLWSAPAARSDRHATGSCCVRALIDCSRWSRSMGLMNTPRQAVARAARTGAHGVVS